ncbi:MAG: hypothetical protein JWQ71_2409 [Pedosphaera sp.]|nr:hypothetical protein [Pedosphaera sp.]
MDSDKIVYWLTLIDSACWGICFWWMFRISSRQDAMLNELKEQGRRIERLSKAEHDLIKEVHPQVGEIKEAVDEVVEAVKEEAEMNSSTSKKEMHSSKRK